MQLYGLDSEDLLLGGLDPAAANRSHGGVYHGAYQQDGEWLCIV